MQFVVQALPALEFAAWLENARGGGAVLDADAYNELAKPSRKVAPRSYADVDPKIYEYILQLAAPMAAATPEAN
jgi:cytochrome o ubiquinol oxidase subunit 2